jgi:energy-converting hydrogenase Eha subunit H
VLLCLESLNGVQGACLLLVEKALIKPEMLGEVGVAGGLCVEAANLTVSIDPLELVLLLEEGDR